MKSMKIRAAAALAIAALAGNSANASAPSCQTFSGQGYCQYTGKVTQLYVNSNGEILLYFDAPIAAGAPAAAGISGVSNLNAAAFLMSQNPDYAKLLYASLLSAQARGATVQVQLWGTHAGYMKLDRVWVFE